MNAKFLPAAITHVRRITVPYPSVHCSVQYSNVTIAYIRLVTQRKCVLSTTKSRMLAFGYTQYGRSSLAIAGLLVFAHVST